MNTILIIIFILLSIFLTWIILKNAMVKALEKSLKTHTKRFDLSIKLDKLEKQGSKNSDEFKKIELELNDLKKSMYGKGLGAFFVRKYIENQNKN